MAVTTKTKAKKVQVLPDTDTLPFSLQLIAIADVKESPRNAKQHTPTQVADIIKSIKEFGFRDPIAVDGNYEIVEGHGRVRALTQMGVLKVPALVFNDMSPDQIRAYRITHNQLTLSTGFDVGLLALELRDITSSGMDLDITGFTLGDLESFELQMETKVQPSAKEPKESAGQVEASETQETTEITQATFQYVMIFDSKEQHTQWSDFVKWLKINRAGETIAERVTGFVTEAMEAQQ